MDQPFEVLANAIANSHKAFDLANINWNVVKDGFADLKVRLEKLEANAAKSNT